MANASSVVDVILGEAGGQTVGARYADMINIASTILNRSTHGRVAPEKVVAVQSEFNAYGKPLPAGVEAYRATAEKIWQQVRQTGPVHNGMFFATPGKTDNLPPGLQQVGAVTGGHVYFTDPQARSFLTADGYVQPFAPTPAAGPIPEGRPDVARGPGMAALVSPDYGNIRYAHEAARGPWTTGMRPEAVESANILAANTSGGITINSARREPGVNRAVGGARNSQHMTGGAFDVDLGGMSPAQRSNFVELARMSGATRLGTYDRHPNMLHVDFAKGYKPTQGGVYTMHNSTHGQFAKKAPEWFKAGLEQVTVPTPTARPEPSTVIAGADRPMPTGRDIAAPPKAAEAPVQAIPYAPAPNPVEQAIARDNNHRQFHGTAFEGGMHRAGLGAGPKAGTSVPAPAFNPIPAAAKAAYSQMAASRSAAPPVSLPGTAPIPTARPTIPLTPKAGPIPTSRPVNVSPMVTRSVTPAKSAPRETVRNPISAGQAGGHYAGAGLSAISAVHAGAPPGTVAKSVSDPNVSVMSLPGGFMAHTNSKYGWTQAKSPWSDNYYAPHHGKIAAFDPATQAWGYISPSQAKAYEAKGWITSTSFGKRGPATAPSVSRQAASPFGFLSGLFGKKAITPAAVAPAPAPAAPPATGLAGMLSGLFGGTPGAGMGGVGTGYGPGGYGNPGFGGAHGAANYSGL